VDHELLDPRWTRRASLFDFDAESFVRQAACMAELLDVQCDAGSERGAKQLDRRRGAVLTATAVWLID
jgi:hypothetical protein